MRPKPSPSWRCRSPCSCWSAGSRRQPVSAEPAGIYRITAVPGSLSVLLWTLLHLASLGGARQVIVFAGMAAIALFALVKNWRTATPAQRQAGILPFSGIIRGHQRFVWGEIGWGRLLLTLALWAALLLLHPVVIGPDPLHTCVSSGLSERRNAKSHPSSA